MPKSLQDLSDSELIDVANQLSSAIAADPPAYGSPPAQVTALSGNPTVDAAYEGTDAGKMGHDMLRWRMRDGTTGAWGETISATLAGRKADNHYSERRTFGLTNRGSDKRLRGLDYR
ncbi:MAG: hypothetical protein IT173_01475 [Acidobacteria bacterium]|nr:hypothetical protein [Acidobacteriota bacterium]